MKNKKAFTLIELLVVIAIIALLLAVVMPALRKAKVQARILICRSNLHQWGVVHKTYASDNDEKNAVTIRRAAPNTGTGRHPGEIWLDTVDNEYQSDQLSYEMIAPYVPGYEEGRFNLFGIWKCPANTANEAEDNETREIYNYFRTEYAYLARRDRWDPADYASYPEEICEKSPASRHVFMADFILNWNGVMIFNHGKNGSSPRTTRDSVHIWTTDGPPPITGVNRLFGDGSAVWRPESDFNIKEMAVHTLGRSITEHYVEGESQTVGTFY